MKSNESTVVKLITQCLGKNNWVISTYNNNFLTSSVMKLDAYFPLLVICDHLHMLKIKCRKKMSLSSTKPWGAPRRRLWRNNLKENIYMINQTMNLSGQKQDVFIYIKIF